MTLQTAEELVADLFQGATYGNVARMKSAGDKVKSHESAVRLDERRKTLEEAAKAVMGVMHFGMDRDDAISEHQVAVRDSCLGVIHELLVKLQPAQPASVSEETP